MSSKMRHYRGIRYYVQYRDVRYARIDIRRGEVMVILRKGMNAEDFLEEHWQWVEKHYRQYREIKERALSALSKNEVFILGERYEILRDCESAPDMQKGRIIICPDRSWETRSMLKEVLRGEISRRVKKFSALLGESPEKIFIREQLTKWGTCSSKRNLGFNLRLIFTGSGFLDCTVAHEICHLKHMNHGPEFRKELRALCGDRHPTREDKMIHWFRSEFMMENLMNSNP